jgi:hypothetical protein
VQLILETIKNFHNNLKMEGNLEKENTLKTNRPPSGLTPLETESPETNSLDPNQETDIMEVGHHHGPYESHKI